MATSLQGIISGLLLTGLTWPGLAPAEAIRLPDMGASSASALTPQREKEIGEALMRELRSRRVLLDDPEVEEYISNLGQHLAAATGDGDPLNFTFFVVRDDAINAFAAPGGFIGVNTGLILATQSESELAAVVAHEIAHITQHHMARTFEAMNRLTVPTIAALVAGILIGTQNSNAGMAAIAASQAGAAQYQVDFTRGNEKEADRIGIQTLAQADYDPRSMPAFFERLQTATRYYSHPPEFLSTHPVTQSRIADSRNRAETYPYRQVADSKPYLLVRAKLQVLAEKVPQNAVKRYATDLENGQYGNEEAIRYGYALALEAGGKHEDARRELTRLLDKDPDYAPFIDALARVNLKLNNSDKALKLYQDAIALYPDNRILVRGYATALLETGQPETARRLLGDVTEDHPDDPRAFWLLARSETETGHPVAAHMALAEHYHLIGETASAVDQLERALKQGKAERSDFYTMSRIDARLAQFKAEVKTEKSEESNKFGGRNGLAR